MKHWFVEWLDEWAQKSRNRANKYRHAINGDTQKDMNIRKSFSNTSEIIEWINQAEENAKLYEKWSQLAEDMINCGLEDLAFKFYDAKQSIDRRLPARERRQGAWILDGIAEVLELRIDKAVNHEKLEKLQAVYTTLCELVSTGLDDTFLSYYLRVVRKYPELNLPEPGFKENN